MFDRLSRSFTLATECWDVLMDDPALLVFPLLSSLAIVVLLASFAVPLWIAHPDLHAELAGSTARTARLLYVAGMYLFYLLSYAIVMFFNTALIAVALRRLDGEPASVREGLETALSNLPAVLGYALIAGTIGMILRSIEERVGFIGRIVVAVIGAAWTLASAMTLPVLVVEGVGPVEAISRSLDLLRSNWGENLIGNGSISLGVAVVALPLFGLSWLFFKFALSTHAVGAIVLAALIMAVTVVGLSIVSATLHAIYTAALYRFATGNKDNGAIRQDLLAEAFRQK